MNMKKVFILLLLSGWLIPGPVQADEADDEKALQAAEREVTTTGGNEQAKVDSLAKQYQVDPAVVQKMRDDRNGWGEISIQLAMARQLATKDPATYPTQQAALDRVQTLRAGGSGYGKISKELGFKLGPVVSDVKRSKAEFQSSIKADRPARPEKSDKPEKIKAERMDRAQRERPTRMERPERPERPAHPEKSNR